MRNIRIWSALVLLVPVCAPVLCSDSGDDTARQDRRAALLYRIHCQNCHGENGEGDGPMARLLTSQPADLTSIADNNGGEFPTDTVRQTIDGRGEIRAHGMREMPVWGLTLQQTDRDTAQADEIRARIDDLVRHLKSIQQSTE